MRVDNCTNTPVVVWELDKNPSDGTRVYPSVYGNGSNGTEVILSAVDGREHTWPNGYQYLAESAIGKTTHDIDANTVILSFFSNHTTTGLADSQPLIVSWTNLDIPSFSPPSNGTGHIQEAVLCVP